MQGAGGVGGLLAVTEIPASSAPATYYPLFDGNGNITEYIDGAGSVVAQYQYDPFGNTTLTSGTKANDFAYRFSTKPLDSATGLYYYGYRYYTPQTGRWINRDPIGEQGGLNLYGFVGNDGLVKWDILGKFDGVIFYSNQKITTDVENSISSPRSIEPSKKCPEKCPEFHIEGGYSSDFKTCCSKGKMIPVVPVYTLPPYNGDYNLCINDQANKGHHFAGGKILDWVAYLSPLAYAKAGQVACASVIGLLGLPYPVDCGGRFSEMLAAETCNRKICPVEINGK
jgi:RHS repeat-associated protein